MKFILIILSVSISFSQQKKIKFDANKLNDPKPNWPKISSPFSSDVINYNQTIDQDSIIIEGYRVQVLATRERFKAEKLQSDRCFFSNGLTELESTLFTMKISGMLRIVWIRGSLLVLKS